MTLKTADREELAIDQESIQESTDINPAEEQVKPEQQSWTSLYEKIPFAVNSAIYGVGSGCLFFMTSLSGILTLVTYRKLSIPLGFFTGIADGITSGFLTARGTSQIFTRRPDIWLLTPFVFTTFGGLAALPFVAAVLQATEKIKHEVGIDITAAKPVLGNMALLTYGTLMSIGLVNLVGKLVAYFQWKYRKIDSYKFYQMRKYLEDFRSVSEYKSFQSNPENFLTHKFSYYNSFIALLSCVIAFGFSYAIAPEIPKAIESPDSFGLIDSLNFFGLIPISHFSKTNVGSKVVSCVTGVPLYSMYIATSLRVFPRDCNFLAQSFMSGRVTDTIKVLAYFMFVTMTCMTAIFESIEGGDTLTLDLITLLGIFFLNYSGSRSLIFTQVFPAIAKQSSKVLTYFWKGGVQNEGEATSLLPGSDTSRQQVVMSGDNHVVVEEMMQQEAFNTLASLR